MSCGLVLCLLGSPGLLWLPAGLGCGRVGSVGPGKRGQLVWARLCLGWAGGSRLALGWGGPALGLGCLGWAGPGWAWAGMTMGLGWAGPGLGWLGWSWVGLGSGGAALGWGPDPGRHERFVQELCGPSPPSPK